MNGLFAEKSKESEECVAATLRRYKLDFKELGRSSPYGKEIVLMAL